MKLTILFVVVVGAILVWWLRSVKPKRSYWKKRATQPRWPSSTRGNSRACKSAAHNLNNTIAIGALIYIKIRQAPLAQTAKPPANVENRRLCLFPHTNAGLGTTELLKVPSQYGTNPNKEWLRSCAAE